MSNLTLKDYLQSLDSDHKIALGTVEGCGFLYFGSPSNMDEISKRFEEKRNQIRERLESLRETGDPKYVRHTIEYLQNIVDNYINPMKREIVDHYPKEIDECEAMIVSGDEKGCFWFQSEYDNKYRKADSKRHRKKRIRSMKGERK